MTNQIGAINQELIGKDVFTRDGEKIGSVKELREGYFKVSAAMQFDYWPSTTYIQSIGRDRITLTFDKDRLDEHKSDIPSDRIDRGEAQLGWTDAGPSGEPATSGAGGAAANAVPEPTIHTWAEVRPIYRQDWELEGVVVGQSWEEIEPAYRYGHEMANDPRYQGREWRDAEAELRDGYPAWMRRQGYAHNEGAWNRSQEHTHRTWERVRGAHRLRSTPRG